MTEHLVILASSPRPDVYFNIIGFNARQGVRKFTIGVVGTPADTPRPIATALPQDLPEFVRALMESQYLPTEGGARGAPRPLTRPDAMHQFFEDVPWKSLEFTFRAIEEHELRDFLTEQRRSGASFDITACKNTALAGAVAWLVSKGGSPIHSFEMSRPMYFDERDLLPYLNAQEYSYPDLSSSPLILGATRRVNAGTLYKRTFWAIAIAIGVAVATLTWLLPPELETPLFAAAATVATVVSAVAIWVRDPN
jgi:hypothetical protein